MRVELTRARGADAAFEIPRQSAGIAKIVPAFPIVRSRRDDTFIGRDGDVEVLGRLGKERPNALQPHALDQPGDLLASALPALA